MLPDVDGETLLQIVADKLNRVGIPPTDAAIVRYISCMSVQELRNIGG